MERCREGGFTLIELLLAAALTGLALIALCSFYYYGVGAWNRGIERMESQQSARAAMDLMVRQLRFADWVETVQGNGIHYRLKGDFMHGDPGHYRRFRLQGEQLLLEEIRNSKIYAYNVVAQGIEAVDCSLDSGNNVHITITAGDGGGAALQSSVRPRNLP